jgi:hypothetical protein
MSPVTVKPPKISYSNNDDDDDERVGASAVVVIVQKKQHYIRTNKTRIQRCLV